MREIERERERERERKKERERMKELSGAYQESNVSLRSAD